MELNRRNTKKILFIVCFSITFCLFLMHIGDVWGVIVKLFNVLLPVIIGFCFAFIVDPVVGFFERRVFFALPKRYPVHGRGVSRGLSILLTLLLAAGLIALFFHIVIPEVEDAIAVISNTLPSSTANFVANLNTALAEHHINYQIPSEKLSDWNTLLTSAADWLQKALGFGSVDSLLATAKTVLSRFVTGLFGIILSIYTLAQKERLDRALARFIRAYHSEKRAEHIFRINALVRTSFRNFITGQVLDALIMAALCFVGMKIFRFPYAGAVCAVVGVMVLVPQLGSWIAGTIGALLSLTQSFTKALLFVVFYETLVQIKINLISPKVVGKVTGLPGFLVLISVIVGGNIAGVVGMLIAVPICSIIDVLLREDMAHRLERKNAKPAVPSQTEESELHAAP
ncbi:MAG: AI-2E family transporter [Oscillospiraceae bacterium]|jgi:predicted PurR-regulated permease PerM